MVAIIPLTRLIAGTSISTTAAIVPLTLAAIPYTARMVETSIREIPSGLIEAAESMGASPFQIIRKVLIPEALPSVIQNMTVVIVSSSDPPLWQEPLAEAASVTLPSVTDTSASGGCHDCHNYCLSHYCPVYAVHR